jgi:hypothetical protein
MGGDSRPNTRSDADGAFALEGLRFDAEYEVRGFGDKVEAHAKATATSAAPEVVVELTLAPPPRASLTVVVKSDGDPPHDVRVLLCHDGETGKSAQKLYDSLTTTIEDLAPGTIHVHAWADGRVVASADVELAGGEAKRVELALVGGLTVVGTVVDDAGAPVDGAEVGCVESVGCGEGEERKTTSDEDGGFRLSVRVPGAHRIGTTAADHVEVGVVIEDVKAGAAVRIVLPRATTAVFRLRPPEEVEGFRVEWTWIDDAGTNVAGGSDRREADHFDFAIEAPVTARRLSVQVDGFVPIDREVRPVLGKPLDLGEIVLDAGAKLVGRVVGSDGHAVASFGISVKTSDEYESLLVAATAQADGTFEAHGFAPGPVLLDVGAAGFLPTKVRVDASKSAPPVVVKLARGAYVRVRVVDADGRATACDDVHAVASDGTDTSLDAKMAGTFAARLPAGRFRFVATRGDVAVEATESLVEGGTSDVTLRFAR